MLRKILYSIINFLFPSYCVNCGTRVRFAEYCICSKCKSAINFPVNCCDKCSEELTDGECPICSDRHIYFDRHFTIARYEGVIKEILHNYKFNSRRKLSNVISNLILNKLSEVKINMDIVTCVPMSRKKVWKRRYNQSEILAKYVAKKLNKQYFRLMRENPGFKEQKKLGYRDRFFNIIGRYCVIDPDSVKNKHILLIDDIFTTGATVNECARIFKYAGAAEVYSLTIAGAGIKRLDNFSNPH